MRSWFLLGGVVFVVAFVVNVVVTVIWPGGDVRWVASLVVAASVAASVTFVIRRSDRTSAERREG
jgi:hypothetical protein